MIATVKSALIATAVSAAICLPLGAATLLASSVGAEAQINIASKSTSQRVKLGLNKSIVIDLPSDAYDILVANPAVADAVTRTSRRIYLFGKQVGETNIFVFGANGEQIVSIDLSIERDVAGLEDHLRRFLPNSNVRVELINDNVVLTGTAETPLDAKRAEEIAALFVSGGEATTGQYAQTAAGGSSTGGVDINNPDSQRRSSRIVNMIQIVGEDQVTLKVTVAEVSRNVMRQLGVNLIGQIDGMSFNTLGNPANPLEIASGLSNAAVGIGGGSSQLAGYLRAMEQSGVLRTLAEPTLTAVSGEMAQFRVGGDFNLITTEVIDGVRQQTLTPIEYGIGLEFQPTVLSPGRISLKVRTAVSELTTEGSVQYLDTVIPGVRKRLADTTVEIPSGGSMMIAGLVSDNVRQQHTAFPGLSKLPVLGALFRSREFVRNETELVILVTPYLARPVARNELARPDDNFNPASEGAGTFLGRVNRVYGTTKTDRPAGRYHGVVGFIYK
ncbi:MAG: type II and III secretion system protein family protein [Aliihoeflea sp.]